MNTPALTKEPELTSIPAGLPTMDPTTCALLSQHGVVSAYDVLNVNRRPYVPGVVPDVPGIAPAQWTALTEWARRQHRDVRRFCAETRAGVMVRVVENTRAAAGYAEIAAKLAMAEGIKTSRARCSGRTAASWAHEAEEAAKRASTSLEVVLNSAWDNATAEVEWETLIAVEIADMNISIARSDAASAASKCKRAADKAIEKAAEEKEKEKEKEEREEEKEKEEKQARSGTILYVSMGALVLPLLVWWIATREGETTRTVLALLYWIMLPSILLGSKSRVLRIAVALAAAIVGPVGTSRIVSGFWFSNWWYIYFAVLFIFAAVCGFSGGEWRHRTKSGGRDRRFSGNFIIPFDGGDVWPFAGVGLGVLFIGWVVGGSLAGSTGVLPLSSTPVAGDPITHPGSNAEGADASTPFLLGPDPPGQSVIDHRRGPQLRRGPHHPRRSRNPH